LLLARPRRKAAVTPWASPARRVGSALARSHKRMLRERGARVASACDARA
jgi:hypothetical protein